MIGFSDADWAGDVNTRKSTSGYICRIGGATISWKSKRQSIVALSSTEAEYVALESLRNTMRLLRTSQRSLETSAVMPSSRKPARQHQSYTIYSSLPQ